MKQSVFYKYRYYFILLFVLLIGGISLGYSKLMATLDIDADVNVSGVSWNVGFSDISIVEGSFTNNDENYVRIDPSDTSKMSYKITLEKAGDFFEFSIKIKNTGTIDAILDDITTTGTSDSDIIDTAYIDYIFEGLPSIGSSLDKETEKTIRVRIEYMPNMGGVESYTIEKEFDLDYIEN